MSFSILRISDSNVLNTFLTKTLGIECKCSSKLSLYNYQTLTMCARLTANQEVPGSIPGLVEG